MRDRQAQTYAKEALESFFVTPWHFYFENELTDLAEVLKSNGMYEWSQAPRLYCVLRGIGRQDLISMLLSQGISDSSLPLQESMLASHASTSSPSFIRGFLQHQARVVKQQDSTYKSYLDQYFNPERNERSAPLEDLDFEQIGRLLQLCGENESAQNPKLYYVLRSIDALEYLPRFQAKRYSDFWFPFPRRILNDDLVGSLAAKKKFLEVQDRVCSLHWSENIHLNLDGDEHNFLIMPKELGRGGTGVVDDVYSPSFRKHYARKRVFRTSVGLRFFANEIKILRSVHHRHCVSFVCSYTDPDYLAILSLPVADMDLGVLLDTALIPPDRKQLLQASLGCLCVALLYLHGQGILHKDIKPQNILIHGNNLLFTDFGLSADAESSGTTTHGKTPRYCAPEVENGDKRTKASDIWALGCVFVEMLAALRGETITNVKLYFRKNGTKIEHFYANETALQLWMAEKCPADDFGPLGQTAVTAHTLVLQMLAHEMSLRPRAEDLVSRLGEATVAMDDNLHPPCCIDELRRAAKKTQIPAQGTNSSKSSRPLPHESVEPDNSTEIETRISGLPADIEAPRAPRQVEASVHAAERNTLEPSAPPMQRQPEPQDPTSSMSIVAAAEAAIAKRRIARVNAAQPIVDASKIDEQRFSGDHKQSTVPTSSETVPDTELGQMRTERDFKGRAKADSETSNREKVITIRERKDLNARSAHWASFYPDMPGSEAERHEEKDLNAKSAHWESFYPDMSEAEAEKHESAGVTQSEDVQKPVPMIGLPEQRLSVEQQKSELDSLVIDLLAQVARERANSGRNREANFDSGPSSTKSSAQITPVPTTTSLVKDVNTSRENSKKRATSNNGTATRINTVGSKRYELDRQEDSLLMQVHPTGNIATETPRIIPGESQHAPIIKGPVPDAPPPRSRHSRKDTQREDDASRIAVMNHPQDASRAYRRARAFSFVKRWKVPISISQHRLLGLLTISNTSKFWVESVELYGSQVNRNEAAYQHAAVERMATHLSQWPRASSLKLKQLWFQENSGAWVWPHYLLSRKPLDPQRLRTHESAEIQDVLLAVGYTKRKRSADGCQALFWSAMMGETDVVVYLLLNEWANKSLFEQRRVKALALNLAACSGHFFTTNALLCLGADLNFVYGLWNHTIEEVLDNGHFAVVDLISHFQLCKWREKARLQQDAVREAVENGWHFILEKLLQYGADPNTFTAGEYEEPVIFQAVQLQDAQTVILLLKYGACPHYCRKEEGNGLTGRLDMRATSNRKWVTLASTHMESATPNPEISRALQAVGAMLS